MLAPQNLSAVRNLNVTVLREHAAVRESVFVRTVVVKAVNVSVAMEQLAQNAVALRNNHH